jgi:hypothetical protein
MSALPESDLLDAAATMSIEVGLAAPLDLKPLEGGKNNRVFRVPLADGSALVLKSYFADPRDPRDRLGAEWDFASYAWARGVRDIPQPVARDKARHLGLYRFVPGRKLAVDEVSQNHIANAAEFIIAINRCPRDPMLLAPGSEACFSIRQHCETVERRIERLAARDPAPDDRVMVDKFVTSRLLPAWRAVKSRLDTVLTRAGIDASAPIDSADIIVSPSDFGFHNALLEATAGRLYFIDFEYAGRDDPAKLICDFFCQPEIPVPPQAFDGFIEHVVSGLNLPDIHRERCRILLDLYHIKWAGIILNHFMPLGSARRTFAEHKTDGAHQIARAEAQIAHIAV